MSHPTYMQTVEKIPRRITVDGVSALLPDVLVAHFDDAPDVVLWIDIDDHYIVQTQQQAVPVPATDQQQI